ncbi:peptide/nickel transport system ATP-binding protein/oligopeptide transport system ATP-binding protein [Asanoa ferruginea]|uniref:Peptide/nickel transport system ATP-binding protein/oligopeptide transport system ATP-binding protein n=1 Tax=Asanoa ferruginea TaxID=53367 RepID=A0A3D9ZSC0_9ACTN|nr:ABC transporter ATP-binding protein [Asanoa ferruginea]REF99769.1 peptide/nickel transport system ATP-binding protein/oligopeptide transport system ATP-binding protein [Asanoa ferruginea]GIF52480.1 ABC transporter ATP-binding protein [Asanoa ferruginea]
MTIAANSLTRVPGRSDDPLLEVEKLSVVFVGLDATLPAVTDVAFGLYPGETLGVVGESGSGKSVSMMSMLGLTPGRVTSGQVRFDGKDLLKMSAEERRKIRGGPIAMVFQDPMSSLNPVQRIGHQLEETLKLHSPELNKAARKERVVELLRIVGVADPEQRVKQYPHQFSGGMRQRVMIAMAIANSPRVLIADEPTTALDVTIQAQVLDVLRKAKDETDAAVILITHDLGVIAEMADRVMVMYAGRVVEAGTVTELFDDPRHPYTKGLLGSALRVSERVERLNSIPGNPPNITHLPTGCSFHPRCSIANGRERCSTETPELIDVGGRWTACHFSDELRGAQS